MKKCEICGKPVKTTLLCRLCSVKKGKREWPKEFKNEGNILCSYGCGQIAKFQYKNGNVCCSNGSHLCPVIRKKNSESSKGKSSGMLGKHHSNETKQILREKNLGRSAWSKGLTKETDERVKKMSESKKKPDPTKKELEELKRQREQKRLELRQHRSRRMKERWKDPKYREKLTKMQQGSSNGNYKGLDGKWASYTYNVKKLTPIEEVKRDLKNRNILNVRCSYCNKWYRPTSNEVVNRRLGLDSGTCKFYCSEDCKELCSDYGQINYPKGFKTNNRRVEVVSEVRKIVFERDNWECQKCGSDEQLECHHIDPVSQEPFFANDPDSCITLCKKCHIYIHTNIDGCGYNELKRKC